jgi:hypothetical protein
MPVDLVQFKRSFYTPDTVQQLRELESRAKDQGLTIRIDGPAPGHMNWDAIKERPGPTGLRPEWSGLPTGREVYVTLTIKDDKGPEESRRERQLETLWALIIPLGFMPYQRYPLSGPHDTVFHFFGKWALLFDHFLGAGRGEAAWPGFCCAAQVDVGKWEGPRPTERLVQSYLHLLGFNPGAVDGIVASKTQAALKAGDLHSKKMTEVAEEIVKREPKMPKLDNPRNGAVSMPDGNFSINTYGQVRTSRTVNGASLEISGGGRVVIDIFPDS